EEAIRSATRVKTDTVGFRPSAMSTDPSNSNSSMLSRIADAKRRINNLRTTDPTAAYQGRLREIQHIMGNADASSTDPRQSLSFSSGGAGAPESNNDRWTLESGGIRPPGTLFEIRAGFVIPAMLISGIQSDLPGQIIAQISQNVYDTPTGRHMLLPQGSRLVGSYSADVQFGQSRVLVAWQRIIFPDGKALDLGEMPGADGAGYAGFNDQVNDHYFRMFASAVLMSVVTAGITLSQDTDTGSDNNDARSVNQVMAESLGEQLGQVTSQVIAKNLNVSPTLTIRPGYRFNVLVTRDLTFKRPYAAFHYDGQG
ncbi:MAG: conjugal transfer protein TrbI, partial [Oceanicoccus sp.]|nr:conjugal transfer protein TrbI [Oceanicoccus sp.]